MIAIIITATVCGFIGYKAGRVNEYYSDEAVKNREVVAAAERKARWARIEAEAAADRREIAAAWNAHYENVINNAIRIIED